MDGNAACTGCHGAYATSEQVEAHTHHAADSSGSECMNCHMPYTTWGLLTAMRSHTISSPSVFEARDAGRPVACNQCHLDRTLAWTAAQLDAWYDLRSPALPPALAAVPLSIAWTLGGDAGQRALMAWAMGWEPAIGISQRGRGWMTPFLAQLLADPYPAVRHTAARSLERQPGFAGEAIDPLAPESERLDAARRATGAWAAARRDAGEPPDARFLVDDPQGVLPVQVFEALLSRRNDRRVDLAE
jgi:hypothetical protein